MTDTIPVKRWGALSLGEYEPGDATPVAFGGTGANDAAGARANLGAITQAQANSGADSRIAAQKGQPNGLADLDADGKLPRGRLPPIATTETFVVASEAAMLALDAQEGDFVVRTDVSRTFILTQSPASTLANWQQIITPASPVQSVNGQTGPVVLEAADVGAATAAQGALADTAVQPGDLATVATSGQYSDLSGRPTLGTAASANVTDFATAAQGAKADSAVQPGQLSAVATSGNYADLNNRPTLGTIASRNSEDFATAAQGTKADSAVQPGQLATVATSGSYADLSNKPSIPSQPSDIGAQPADPLLTAIAALTTAADQLILATGSDTVAMLQLGAVGKTLVQAADQAAGRSALGAVGLSGDESISGVKSFTSGLRAPSLTITGGLSEVASLPANSILRWRASAGEGSAARGTALGQLVLSGAASPGDLNAVVIRPLGNANSSVQISIGDDGRITYVANAAAKLATRSSLGITDLLPPNGLQAGPIDNPPNIQNGNYQFSLIDRGFCVVKQTSGSANYTIPADSSVAFPVGAYINVAPTDASGSMSIVPASGVTLYMAGSRATTGTRTVVAGGLAAIMKMGANLWVISGAGVT